MVTYYYYSYIITADTMVNGYRAYTSVKYVSLFFVYAHFYTATAHKIAI